MATKKKELIQIGVLMTKQQVKEVDNLAKQYGLSRSAYVRWILKLNKLEQLGSSIN